MEKNKWIAIIGFVSISGILILINLLTTPRLLWGVIPVFGVMWWPIGVFFGKKPKTLSVIGSLNIILLLVYLNLTFSPRVIWAFIPAFAVLWWPMAAFFGRNRGVLSIVGSLNIILLLACLNLVFSPRVMWAFIPAFAVLWWPIAAFLGRNRKALSIIGSLHIIALIIGINAIYSPGYPWAVFVVFPILWWPISIFYGEKTRTIPFSIISAIAITAYYSLINLFIEPRHEFWIYVAYGLLWWPLSRIFYKRVNRKIALVIAVISNSAFMFFLNQRICPDYKWSIFLLGPVVILSIMVFIGKKAKTLGFAVFSYIFLMLGYGLINIFFENRHPFIIYLAFAFAWWPISVSFAKHKNLLRFSIVAFLLLAAFFTATNLVNTPNILWAVYPIACTAFWPLSVLIFGRKRRRRKRLEQAP